MRGCSHRAALARNVLGPCRWHTPRGKNKENHPGGGSAVAGAPGGAGRAGPSGRTGLRGARPGTHRPSSPGRDRPAAEGEAAAPGRARRDRRAVPAVPAPGAARKTAPRAPTVRGQRRRRGAPSAQPALAWLRGRAAAPATAEPTGRAPQPAPPPRPSPEPLPPPSPARSPARTGRDTVQFTHLRGSCEAAPPPASLPGVSSQLAAAPRPDVHRRARRRTHGEGTRGQRAATSCAHRSGGTGCSGAEPPREGGEWVFSAFLPEGKARGVEGGQADTRGRQKAEAGSLRIRPTRSDSRLGSARLRGAVPSRPLGGQKGAHVCSAPRRPGGSGQWRRGGTGRWGLPSPAATQLSATVPLPAVCRVAVAFSGQP